VSCCEAGMKLVELSNGDQATQVHAAYRSAGGRLRYWIGLNDRVSEGSHVWTSGAGCLPTGASWRSPRQHGSLHPLARATSRTTRAYICVGN